MSECERVRALLDDWIDGDLEAADHDAVDGHVRSCAACAAEAASLRALIRGAVALPREVSPDRDLWPSIAARLTRRGGGMTSRSPRFGSGWGLAAAAMLLVTVGAVLGVALGRARPAAPSRSVATPTTRDSMILAVHDFDAGGRDLDRAAADLHAALEQRRGHLSTATLNVLEDNLKVIDDAIARIRAALAADPGNRELVTLLAAIYERKLDLLSTAVSASQRS